MTTTKDNKKMSTSDTELDNLIQQAIDKVGAEKENDICRYLPVPTGGYIHHFTMRKMKNEEREELTQLIQQFIIETEEPVKVAPKPRAARGSRKRRDQLVLDRNDIDNLLNLARQAGERDIVAKLTPKKSLAAVKRELIASIRQGKVDEALWSNYVEVVQAQETALAAEVESGGAMTKVQVNNAGGFTLPK